MADQPSTSTTSTTTNNPQQPTEQITSNTTIEQLAIILGNLGGNDAEVNVITVKAIDGEYIIDHSEKDIVSLGIREGIAAKIKKRSTQAQQEPIDPYKKRTYHPQIKESLQKYKKVKALNDMYPQDPLCTSSLRIRFKFVNGLIHIINRDITSNLLQSIKNAHGSVKGFYVQGPQGVGKSHSIYQVVCALREDINNRVLYLPDCKGWGEAFDKNTFFFDIALVAFEVAGDNFVQEWTSKILLDVSPQRNLYLLDLFLKDMATHCCTKNLSIYMIFDQHNSLTDEQRQTYPLSIIEGSLVVSNLWDNRLLVVISGSANNKYTLKVATNGQWPIFPINNGFTDDEYNKWAKIKNIKNDQDTFDKVKSVTSFIPVEIQELLESDTKKDFSQIDDAITSYTHKKSNQISLQDISFRREFLNDPETKDTFIRCIVLMDLNVPFEKTSVFINQQLMVLRNGYICPLIPMVVPILKSVYLKYESYASSLASIYQSVFRGTISLTNDARGRIVEHYLCDKLKSMNNFSVLAKRIEIVTIKDKKGDLFNQVIYNDVTISIKDYKVKEFSGNEFDTNTNFNISLLIVPTSPNYPSIDFYFWDCLNKHLIVCQVTVGSKHKNEWSKKQSKMEKILPEGSKISFLWIATENLDVNFSTFDKQNIVYLSDLMNDQNFLLLKDFI